MSTMIVEMNLNTVYHRAWLEKTPTGWRGMSHVKEVTLDGRVVRDETKPTGCTLTWGSRTHPSNTAE